MSEQEHVSIETGTPRWVGLAVAVLAVFSVVSLGFGWAAWSAAKRGQVTNQDLIDQIHAFQDSYSVLTKRLEKAEATNADLQADVGVVTDKLKLTQGELAHARTQAKQIREEYSKQIGEMENAVRAELAEKASAEDLTSLSGDVNGVRTDLEEAKKNLGMARGELGTLIARNHEEIDQLRRLGERDYFEFTLDQKGSREKLGSVMLELRGTNAKKGNFTVALYADDMRLEKKNRSVNEPIYFYTRSTRQPMELVVNQVTKNKITGYISVPKSASAVAKATGN
jgi:chromosome segregation ATPase